MPRPSFLTRPPESGAPVAEIAGERTSHIREIRRPHFSNPLPAPVRKDSDRGTAVSEPKPFEGSGSKQDCLQGGLVLTEQNSWFFM
jgi:hypothetical protein